VLVRQDAELARRLTQRIMRDAERGARFSLFETTIAGVPYQVVVRLLYEDAYREHLAGAFGFTVNLPWVRAHYFGQLASQVSQMATVGATTRLRVDDETGTMVAGSATESADDIVSRRTFALKFYDPWVGADTMSSDVPRASWTIGVGVPADSVVGGGFRGAHRSLILGGLAAVALALGLVQTARATRTQARLVEMRSEFVSAVTHELKTPLSTIRAIGETVARGRVRSERDLREYAQLVVQESRRLTRLVDNLLAYARVVDVAQIYSFEPLEARELLEQVRREFDPQLESRGFEVDTSVPDDLPPLRADRTALGLLLGNVIDNAIRYSRDSRWLGLAARREGSQVAITISDRGIGIPADEIAHVTARFVRGRGAAPGGSGLGLAIARRIAEDHGGGVEIVSAPGEGTRVTVTIPGGAELL
jgi:signal transduction histidine kinase